MKFLLLAIFAVIFVASASAAPRDPEGKCSNWLGYCQTTDQCCRYLICSSYQLKCVPKGGLIIPGADTRPIGTFYPPGFHIPESELDN